MKILHYVYAAIPILLILIAAAIIWQNSKTWKSERYSARPHVKPEVINTQADRKLAPGQKIDSPSPEKSLEQKKQPVKAEKVERKPQVKHEKKAKSPDEQVESVKELEKVIISFKASRSKSEKIELLEGIGLANNKKVFDLILLALDDSDGDVRITAANMLDDFDSAALIPCVTKAMADPNAEVRTAAVNALGNIDSPEVTNILLRGVGDKDEEVRDAIFNVLSDKDSSTKEAIAKKAITSQYPDVKSKIADMLIEIPSHNVM
ncbi:MAG: HEAT repeat domain-containing protein, partial [Lentisphaerota bacterium]